MFAKFAFRLSVSVRRRCNLDSPRSIQYLMMSGPLARSLARFGSTGRTVMACVWVARPSSQLCSGAKVGRFLQCSGTMLDKKIVLDLDSTCLYRETVKSDVVELS